MAQQPCLAEPAAGLAAPRQPGPVIILNSDPRWERDFVRRHGHELRRLVELICVGGQHNIPLRDTLRRPHDTAYAQSYHQMRRERFTPLTLQERLLMRGARA